MKHFGGALACLLALAVIHGCTGKEDTNSGGQKETGSGKTQEETLIEKTLTDLSSANTQFPKTKDTQSILRFYAQDYAGINNGKSESLKDIEKYLFDLIDRINLGEPLGISSKITNIKTSATGPLGWATYESEYKVGSGGAVLQTNQEQCTAIFKRQGESWLIRHEHCSTMAGVTHLAQQLQAVGCPIVGNTRSSIYHKPGGRYYDQMQVSPDAVCFKSEEDARSHGYRPSQQ
jgi:ketosteroid isomerase-like protein